jgi:hypothetical protein
MAPIPGKAKVQRIVERVWESANTIEERGFEKDINYRITCKIITLAFDGETKPFDVAVIHTTGKVPEKLQRYLSERRQMIDAELARCTPDYNREQDEHAQAEQIRRQRMEPPTAVRGQPKGPRPMHSLPSEAELSEQEPMLDLPEGRAF